MDAELVEVLLFHKIAEDFENVFRLSTPDALSKLKAASCFGLVQFYLPSMNFRIKKYTGVIYLMANRDLT